MGNHVSRWKQRSSKQVFTEKKICVSALWNSKHSCQTRNFGFESIFWNLQLSEIYNFL